ncbi:MAG: flagellar hook-associated protein FlgL [Rhodoferax sp.]
MASTLSRIGFANTYDNAQRNLQMRQTSLSNLQENLTSGKKVVRASDDPTGAAQAERARNRLQRAATDQRALEMQKNAIASAESALGNVVDTVQSFRELVVSAGSGAKTAADRKTIATQLTGMRQQVLALANLTDTNGQPLFAGLGSALAPFVGPQSSAPTYTYNGLPGQSASSEYAIPFTLDGDAAFMFDQSRDRAYQVQVSAAATPNERMVQTSPVTVSTPGSVVLGDSYTVTVTGVAPGATAGTEVATYTVEGVAPSAFPLTSFTSAEYPATKPVSVTIDGIPGLSLSLKGDLVAGDAFTVAPESSLFNTLDNAISGIETAANGNAAQQAVGQALANIDTALSKLSSVRGQAGDLLNRADRINDNQEKRKIQLEGDRSRAEDLDMVKGVSDFQNQQTGYQAALQSYAQVQKLSLFNFIS